MRKLLTPLSVLQEKFGYSKFRGLQEEAISSVIKGEDLLLLMSTGGGKSLCYQIPALCLPGMALVISPLIALMEDQVQALKKKNIRAEALHSEISQETRKELWKKFRAQEIDLLYISPERLLYPRTLEFLKSQNISFIALDEAHCLSSWGHDFRPEYRNLTTLKEHFPHAPLIAVTATADKTTQQDILSVLKIPHARLLRSSFHRKNIHIEVFEKGKYELGLIFSALEAYHQKGATIIYCNSRIRAEKLAQLMREKKNLNALAFHAGLPAEEKRDILARFSSGESLIIIATIAFGMGIDRPDVRLVIHIDMPSSLESYYQQIGRAGRDQKQSYAILFYNENDIARRHAQIANTPLEEKRKALLQERFNNMIEIIETYSCRTKSLLSFFGEEIPPCKHCDNCKLESIF